ncbi:PREDICTED: F-box protein At5g03100-like [Prunus mume]|uniref:F-box protein At5g03100-like n=1 Tax=Prunus mume TaxID=102107 RepID=A0ABM0PA40_PRUMU|nr:PREDICTED: F-box protein At5g03100-like [Prunus mume]
MAYKGEARSRNKPNTNTRLRKKKIVETKAMASTRPYNYLPGLIIYHILQLLPTKIAAQASFVSKQWAEACSSIPVFEFKEGDPYNHDGKFRLRMRYQGDAKVLDAWLRSAVERSVKELDISLRNVPTVKPYCLPRTLFDAKLLTTLSLEDVRIEDNADQPISLPSVKSMSFKMVDFEGMALSNLISGCPWIEHLSLNLCDLGSWTWKLKISSSSLKSFEIFDCYSRHIEVEAKNLESFKFDSDFELLESMALFDCTNLKCINIFSQHLQHLILYALCQNSVEATINTPNLHYFDFSGYLMANVSMAPLKYLSDATLILLDHIRGPTFSLPLNHFSTLRDYLEHFDCSKKLKLYIHDAEGVMFPEDFREAFPSPLPNLKHLNIVMNSAVEGIKSELMESLHWMAPSVENPSIESLSRTNSSSTIT